MPQSRISEFEQIGKHRASLTTLFRLASAFDVALEVGFLPFSQLVNNSDAFQPDEFNVKSFNEEYKP